jgi:NAD(P)H-dependent FMN reductase
MTNILLVVGSARKGRVADKVLGYIQEEVAKRDDITASVADLAEANLPFFDNEKSPNDPDYVITNETVQKWADQVGAADAVVLIAPEYNHGLPAIEKNAIDSLGAQWNEKPVTVVAYGWYAGKHSIDQIRELSPVVKMKLVEPFTGLTFMQQLNPDGSLLDEAATREQINATLDAIA